MEKNGSSKTSPGLVTDNNLISPEAQSESQQKFSENLEVVN